MLRSKIHRLTVTRTDVEYEGSLTVDGELLRRADILPFEEIHVWNTTRGVRITTYAIVGGPGEVCVNGAAALLMEPGDRIIVASFTTLGDAAAHSHKPNILLVDDRNRVQNGLKQA
jgi:aspartate 1-decarboxylase